jgi:hypothetical protein
MFGLTVVVDVELCVTVKVLDEVLVEVIVSEVVLGLSSVVGLVDSVALLVAVVVAAVVVEDGTEAVVFSNDVVDELALVLLEVGTPPEAAARRMPSVSIRVTMTIPSMASVTNRTRALSTMPTVDRVDAPISAALNTLLTYPLGRLLRE